MKTQIAAAIALSLVAGVTFAAPSFYDCRVHTNAAALSAV
jgi:hypothetical protein